MKSIKLSLLVILSASLFAINPVFALSKAGCTPEQIDCIPSTGGSNSREAMTLNSQNKKANHSDKKTANTSSSSSEKHATQSPQNRKIHGKH